MREQFRNLQQSEHNIKKTNKSYVSSWDTTDQQALVRLHSEFEMFISA